MAILRRQRPHIRLCHAVNGSSLHRRTRLVLVGHGRIFRLMLPLVLTNIDQQFVHEHGIGHTTCIIAESHPEGLQCVQWGEVRPKIARW